VACASIRNFQLALTGAGVLAVMLTAWEFLAWGWHPAREEPAYFNAYHLARTAACALAAGGLVWLLGKCRPSDGPICGGVSPAATALGWLSLLTACAFTMVFAASPASFHYLAGEDRAVEWASALLLFAGSALFAAAAAAHWRQLLRFELLILGAMAGGYFVMAMEEISWMQRVLGYGTPEAIAERNWQGEFNLHNLNTDIFELVYYTGSAGILALLPLLGEATPSWKPLVWFRTVVPTRTTAALAAPMLAFTYGQWNLLPIQLAGFAGLFALIAFACRSKRRGERVLFLALAGFVLLAEILFLALGHRMPDVPDASEFKELFIALGFAGLAWESRRRVAAKAAPAPAVAYSPARA
jgi:hypothetical protein